MTSSEFSPYEAFNRLLNRWWIVALVAILGGIFGFVFSQLHPPVYEATATYLVTVDLNRFPFQGVREDLVQYNEDMAVNTTQGVLLSSEVLTEVISQAKDLGISITGNDLLKNSTIERKHELWELRYRSGVPQVAQTTVNLWANIGYQAMLSWQENGKTPDYVIFNSPSQAFVPLEPVYYDRNKVILAGLLAGFIVGILVSNLISWPTKKALPKQ